MMGWEKELVEDNLAWAEHREFEAEREDALGQKPVMIMAGRIVPAVEIDSEIASWMGGF